MSATTDNINSSSISTAQETANTAKGVDGATDNSESKKGVDLKQLYEQSTQYNHWRYTQGALNDLRSGINQEAISSTKQNIEEERQQRIEQGLTVDDLPLDLKFLNVDEELALLGFYERRMVQIFRYWKLPAYAMATAIVYMKRFFLENTVMDYHPKDVMLTCMFLARKTENYLMTIEDFSNALKSPRESILNLEFLICKNLRFHFTVHHPYRPCLGFFYDMQAVTENVKRLQKVYETALKFIDTSLHTDLCFLYQPSQIALATIKMACKEESYDFERYASYKFKSTESAAQKYNETLLPILDVIESVLLEDPRCIDVEKSVATEIDKRLKMCKDPAKNPDSLM
ncbi:cyclin-like protein [Dissophora ornata]|nr:cyclin-like protein [Dissophora ornata]